MRTSDFYQNVHERKKVADIERSRDRIRKVIQLVESKPGEILVDVGSGDGSITMLLAKKSRSYTVALDISHKAIRITKSKGLEAVVCDVTTGFPFRDCSVDHLFCGALVEHLFDVDGLFDEIKRTLKPGGYCLLTTPNLGWIPNRFLLLLGLNPIFTEPSHRYDVTGFFARTRLRVASGHLHLFTQRALVALLKLHGFHVEKIKGARFLEGHLIKRLHLLRFWFMFCALDRLFSLRASWAADIIVKFRKARAYCQKMDKTIRGTFMRR